MPAPTLPRRQRAAKRRPSPARPAHPVSNTPLRESLRTALLWRSLRLLAAPDLLVIDNNPELASVTISELSSVDSLELTGNPALATSVFEGVLTFERIEPAEPADA